MDILARLPRKAMIGGLVLLAGSVIAALSASADWPDELKLQALQSKRCEVGFMTDVKVRIVDGQQVIFARIHCHDGRAFDASRVGDTGQFTFAACDTKSC